MARTNGQHTSVTRRNLLLASGASGIAALAGCTGSTGSNPDGTIDGDGNGGTDSQSREPTVQNAVTSPLKAGGSSTVYPITSKASSIWNYNPPATDTEYWPFAEYGISTDMAMANFWAGKYGFEPGQNGNPPFRVAVGLSHSGVGLTKLQQGQLDIGDASAPVEAELENVDYDKFVDHVVGVDAQPIVVSEEIYKAGVTQIKAETVRAIYRGEIDNWQDVPGYDGPSRSIQAIGRAVGSGTDTAFRANMLGDPDAQMPGVDVRKGENQQVAKAIAAADNAVAYMALAFVSDDVPAVALNFDGTVYEPGKNLADKGYPLARDLHAYTYEGTSKKEASFLRMLIHDFGQGEFVGPAGYAQLSDSRQEEELAKLPGPST
ncbi:MAG: PstS family phosphate ABC transporter substrate-binding protein [Halanaeroarchaeum sp.]